MSTAQPIAPAVALDAAHVRSELDRIYALVEGSRAKVRKDADQTAYELLSIAEEIILNLQEGLNPGERSA